MFKSSSNEGHYCCDQFRFHIYIFLYLSCVIRKVVQIYSVLCRSTVFQYVLTFHLEVLFSLLLLWEIQFCFFLYVIFSINFSLADIENYLDGGTGRSRKSRRDRKQMGFKSIRFTARQSQLINADDLVSFQLNVQYIVFLFRFNVRIGISCAQTIDYFSLAVRIFM